MRKFENVNQGEWYPYKFDRRHDFSLVLSHQFNEKVDLGLTWVYGTGSNITMMDASYPEIGFNSSMNVLHDASSEIQYYSSRNNYRMQAYHRLDLCANFRKKKNGENVLGVSELIMHTTEKTHTTSIFKTKPILIAMVAILQKVVAKQVSLFPIIPSVSYHFKF